MALASKCGRRQREPQQIERLVLVFLERAQRAADMFAAGLEVHLDRLALERLVEGLGVELAGTLVEQIERHVADACLAFGILGGTAAEGEIERDQRHGGIAHEPDFDAARAHHPLDLGRIARRRGSSATNAAARRANRPRRAMLRCRNAGWCMLTSVSPWSDVSLTRYPVTERRLSSHLRAASRTLSGVTARTRSGQPAHLLDASRRSSARRRTSARACPDCPAHRSCRRSDGSWRGRARRR